MPDGTARAIGPIADQVLAWVRDQRVKRGIPGYVPSVTTDDEIRRIELCATAAREAAMFHDLYGMETPDAPGT